MKVGRIIMDFFTTSDGAKIYYKVNGEGQPIIFIHGFSEDHRSFKIQQNVLSRKYKIITYDLRGHGRSDRVDYGLNLRRYAQDLKELIDKLKLEKVVLVGWSMGGSIVFEYIQQFGMENIYKICIVDTSSKALNEGEWNKGLLHGKYDKEKAKEDLKLIKNNWVEFAKDFIMLISPSFEEKQFNLALDKMKKNSPHVMYYMWKSILEQDYRNVLGKINVPTLLLFGEKSTLYSMETAKYLNRNIKDSKLIVFKNCTHLLVLENPIKFNQVLEEFI